MVAAGRGLVTGPAGILVAGAGPAGLALALQAHDHGADVRVIDRRPEAFRPSRAPGPRHDTPGILGRSLHQPPPVAHARPGGTACRPLIPALMRRRHLVAAGIRLLSQLAVSYRRSPLSVEGTPQPRGGPRAGDRLPDQTVTSAGRTLQLHQLLARPGVHVLLERDADRLDDLATGPTVHVHRLTSAPGHGLIAVRPDGHIGFRCRTADANQLTAWLAHMDAPLSNGAAARGPWS
jgi:Aromatic-ring hydroxylase, C-terminal/FAD binding domain